MHSYWLLNAFLRTAYNISQFCWKKYSTQHTCRATKVSNSKSLTMNHRIRLFLCVQMSHRSHFTWGVQVVRSWARTKKSCTRAYTICPSQVYDIAQNSRPRTTRTSAYNLYAGCVQDFFVRARTQFAHLRSAYHGNIVWIGIRKWILEYISEYTKF